MKGKIIGKILIILLAIVIVLPLSAFAASAEETPNTNAVPGYIEDIYRNGRTPSEQAEYEEFIRLMKMKEDSSRIDEMFKEKKKGLSKDDIKDISEGIDAIRKSLPGMVQSIKDAQNGGDFDTAACVDNVVSLISDVASCCGPYGAIVSSVVDLGNTIFKLAMGGESSTSEMAQMEDRLNQQLDDIQNQLSEIEEQINGLSDEINESTNTIISGVTSAIDNADAKAYLRTFMLSGEGNFSYNQYRNYIYGASTGNSKANTAYYALLKQSIANDASDEITKYYYDQLYTAIMNDRDVYYDYIMGSDDSKSIVQYYYDVVSARPDLMNESGMTAEYAAIMFAYDIYQTELMANQIIAICNLYQYAQMCLSGEEYYCYDQSTGKIVTLADIDGAEGIDSMQEQINIRIDEIHDQLASDIAYILNLDDSYIVESADGDLFEVVNSNPDTYGKVLTGQTIYLNSIPEEICDLFGFEANDFTYVVSVPTHMDGAFLVDSNANRIEATLYYNGEELDTMSFTVGTNAKFNGGNGTTSDPYLIASAAQFARISDGLDKHYRLICDIDFNGATITPIGQKVNSNDAIVYDEFVGSLDGNGYTISNLNVVGHTYAGLFGIIGEPGEVADLKLYNIKVSTNITNAEKSTSEFYAGMIAGKNNGIIKYCSIDSDGTTAKITVPNYDLTPEQIVTGPWTIEVDAPIYGLFLDVNNSTRNRNIYAYAGGIAGANNYAVVGCTVANSHISASSTHNFGGDKTSTNKNNVYVGGVCGYSYGAIAHSIVKESVKISSYAKSIYNPETTVNPYVVAHAGGIVAKVNSLNDICQVESGAEIIRNDAALDCESNWGEHYKNCSDEKDTYIPKYSEDELKAIIATEDLEAFIAKTERNYTVTFECPDTVYEAGRDVFNTDNLKFFINGVEKEYEIVGIYGFDAQNEDFNSVSQNIVVLFGVEIEGETVYFAQDITVTIKENVVTSIEILNLKDSYVKDTFSLEGLVIKYNYAVGNPEYVTINSGNISQVRYFGNITTFGKQSIALLYNGDTVEFEINVVCGHGNNFTSSTSGYAYDESLSKAPTCYEIGYNAYVCGTCGDSQYFYLRKTEHTPDYENAVGATDATCTEEGNTGKICCVDCGETLIDGKVIPKLNHYYVYLDGDKHVCSNGSHSEYHHYTVTESVKSKINADGSESWYIVYTYTCVCQKDGEVFAKEVVDENLIVDANTKLPTIMVSDGYALSAGDEVVVYVQLLNNPGINAANFGIRYSEGLELISIHDGTVLKGSLVTDGLAVNYGYNFVWGNDSLFSNDGNLLKLTFRVSEYAELGDSYDISLVYAIGNGAQGGFGTSTGKQYFITKDGTVKVVERLPGDINNDGVVDLMDAIEIGKFVVGKTDSIDETYANVDLSYNNDGDSNVDIMDMVAILQYITGGYGTNLLTQDFEIILNTNGYDKILNDLLVSIYGDNNTYDEAGLAELERQGYKFLGWYDQMVGGNLIDINGDVRYNPNQKKQTLYAHWELNKLVFEANGATSGVMSDVYYTEDSNVTVENTYKKEYNVAFVSDNVKHSDKTDLLKYQLSYWEGSNGKQYTSLKEAVKDLMNAHYGVVTLKAIWSNSPTVNYPEWLINGYENEIGWYGSANPSTITKINSNVDILKYAPVNGYYMVYAKHTPIVYDIVFDFNNGTSNNIPTTVYSRSVESPYTIVGTVQKTGNEFKSWTVFVDGVKYSGFEGTTIGYIPGAKQGSIITVMAIWDETEYTIDYNLNGGSWGEIEGTSTYYVSEVDKMNLPDPYHTEYPDYIKFLGWYRDEACTEPFDTSTLKVNPDNITLYAKWENYEHHYISEVKSKGSITTTGDIVIIDCRGITSSEYIVNGTIYTSDTTRVYFIGNSGTTLKEFKIGLCSFDPKKTDVYVSFDNIKMTGMLFQKSGSLDLNTTLECANTNSITALQGEQAILDLATLTIKGHSLYVKGGNGVDATTAGGNGTAGATAIIVDNLIIDMTGELTVVGGDGGSGSEGKTGSATSSGGNGGVGGNGGMAINCQTVSMINPKAKVHIIGGNGGDGGKGGYITNGSNNDGMYDMADAGNGGDGGNGGAPILVSSLNNLTCSSLELRYGNGGNGGDGGNGGNPTVLSNDYKPDQKSAGGNGGNGGSGFVAGNGGDGGDGGGAYGTDTWNHSPWLGVSGDGGDGGNGGDKIVGVLYTSGVAQSLQTSESCGKHGDLGSRGPILDPGEENQGKYGSNGVDGDDGGIDDSYFLEFEALFQ